MCGGQGSRLGGGEKPLRTVGGRPMVQRVRAALADSRVETVYAVTSPHAPETARRIDRPTIDAAGAGYVADLQTALADDRITQPVVTVVADLPLLSAASVDRVLGAHEAGPLSVVVPVGRVRALGFSVDTTVTYRGLPVRPAGLNVVAPGDDSGLLCRDRCLAANVNRPRDLAVGRWLAAPNSQP